MEKRARAGERRSNRRVRVAGERGPATDSGRVPLEIPKSRDARGSIEGQFYREKRDFEIASDDRELSNDTQD